MNANFEAALKKGYLEPVEQDGKPFEVNGKIYYQPADSGAKMIISRFHYALDIIRMHEELKLSSELNGTAWARVRELCSNILSATDGQYIKDAAIEIMQIEGRIQSRMEFGKDIEHVYQLAAIYFITDDEDPAVVNAEVIRRKVSEFKSYPELYGFFLSMPLSRFLNSSLALEPVTQAYLKELNVQEILDLNITLLRWRRDGVESGMTSFISSRMETLKESVALINSLSKSTTTP